MTQQLKGDKFNATEELDEIRRIREIARRSAYRKSRLRRHQEELIQMREKGASFADLQTWLRVKKRISVARSTVQRFLAKFDIKKGESK